MHIFPDDLFDLSAEFRRTASVAPDRIAVMEPYRKRGAWHFRSYTFRQLSADADRAAAALHARGFGPGLRTVFMAPPSYQTSVVAAALSQLGAVFLWIDPSVGYRNVAERLGRVDPQAFVGVPLAHMGRMVFGWGPRLVTKSIVVGGTFPGAISFKKLVEFPHTRTLSPAVHPDDPSNVLYTTGSTGPAKPALYSHRQFSHVYRAAHHGWRFAQIFDAGEVPVDMAGFPAFGFIPLSAGATLVVPPIDFARWTPETTPAREVCEVIEAAQVTSLFASPAFLERIAHYASEHPSPLHSVRRIIGGGAPLFAPLVRDLQAVMHPDGEAWSNYGATEALPSTEIGGHEVLRDTAARTDQGEGICVGLPFPGVDLRVVAPIGAQTTHLDQTTTLPPGEVGELIVRGPNISTEYFLDAENTRKNKFYAQNDDSNHTWHRLGDVGHLDEKGRVWVRGRVNQCIQIAGHWLFPISIEAIFDQHPKVRRSGLAVRHNIPDTIFKPVTTDIAAIICIEFHPGLTTEQKDHLITEFQTMLLNDPRLKHINDVTYFDALPVDPRHNAKIERGELTRMLNAL